MDKHNPTILIVEDAKPLLKAWTQIFTKEGLNVITAPDGQRALGLALKHHPDLLVVDLVMPNSDGLSLIKKLREDKWGQKLQVMFLSGWLSGESPKTQLAGKDAEMASWSFSQVVKDVKNKLKLTPAWAGRGLAA